MASTVARTSPPYLPNSDELTFDMGTADIAYAFSRFEKSIVAIRDARILLPSDDGRLLLDALKGEMTEERRRRIRLDRDRLLLFAHADYQPVASDTGTILSLTRDVTVAFVDTAEGLRSDGGICVSTPKYERTAHDTGSDQIESVDWHDLRVAAAFFERLNMPRALESNVG